MLYTVAGHEVDLDLKDDDLINSVTILVHATLQDGTDAVIIGSNEALGASQQLGTILVASEIVKRDVLYTRED